MAKDYAYRTAPNKRPPTKQPDWRPRTPAKPPAKKSSSTGNKNGLVIVIILVLALLVLAIYYFKHHPIKHLISVKLPSQTLTTFTSKNNLTPTKFSSTHSDDTQQQSVQSVQFDFYTTLPAASPNVMPPQVASSSATANSTATQSASTATSMATPTLSNSNVLTASTTATASSYLLQLASLNTMEDAVAMQTKLKTAGFSNIHIARIQHAGSVWYLVQAGPFSTRQAAAEMQQKLQQQNFDSVIEAVE